MKLSHPTLEQTESKLRHPKEGLKAARGAEQSAGPGAGGVAGQDRVAMAGGLMPDSLRGAE